MTPKERATRAAEVMWGEDNASPWFGMQLVEVDEGRAITEMTIQKHHVNGHDICHGGVIFSLADSAFAFACNSRNQNTVAQYNVISYIFPGKLGDTLRASAHEVSLTGRHGIYDVTISNQDEVVIAEFRGMSRAIKGQLFDESETQE